jgi:alpha-glucosidase
MGNEWNKGLGKITYEHKVVIPFIRGLAGPMDYTPGGMRNTTEGFSMRETLPMVTGTRCNEMALYVLYNEPLKMFCDAPTVYEQEPAVINFLAKIPTTWDDTKPLSGVIGDHLITARRTGDVWYLGGITGDEARLVDLDCSFLEDGDYIAEIFSDGLNSHRIGTDYKQAKIKLNKTSTLKINMAKGGGMVARFEKVK